MSVSSLTPKLSRADGWAKWERINPGSYEISATKDGHLPKEAKDTVELAEGDKKKVPLELDPLEIYLDGNPIVDATRKVIVGAKIELSVMHKGAKAAGTAYKWEIPGVIVKDYKGTKTKGEKKDITPGDLEKSEAEFYWVDGSDGREVKCTITIDGEKHTVTDKLDVKRPACTFSATTSDVKVTTDYIRPGTWLAFGGRKDGAATRKAGINFTAKVEMPAGFAAGEWNYVQINDGKRFRTKNDDTKEKYVTVGWMLDTTYPYEPAPYDPAAGSPGAYATGAASHSDSDSPATRLTGSDKKKSIDEKFKMFVMFKPSGADSIYVPLKVIGWYCKGAATRSGAAWALDAGSADSDADPATDTTEFPTWTANVDTISWEPA